MRKKSGKFISGALALSMVVGLTACGSASTTETTTADTTTADASSTGGQTLEVLLSEEPGEEDAFGQALDEWASETGNTVDTIIISNDDIATKFPSMAKNNDLPDLMSSTGMHQEYPDEFVDISTVLDTSIFNENALKIVGKAYQSDEITGAPKQYTTTCMFYNKDAFEKAGIEAPTVDDPWTWDEFYQNAALLQENGGTKYGFAADVSRARYDILMYANGGSIVQQSGDTYEITLNSDENVSTLQAFIDANDDGVMPKAIWAGGTTDNPDDYFANGDAAILLSGSWEYSTLATNVSDFEFGVMPTPVGTSSQAAIIGGSALAIPKNAENVELAEEFLQWFYSSDEFQSYVDTDQGPSVLNDIAYTPTDEKAAEDYSLIQNEVNYVTDSFMTDEASAWRSYEDAAYRDTIKQAVAGEYTAQDALDTFAEQLSEDTGWSIAQ